ncbi:unnamed protein product, partial [Rotaria magnacalcarata]
DMVLGEGLVLDVRKEYSSNVRDILLSETMLDLLRTLVGFAIDSVRDGSTCSLRWLDIGLGST